MINKYKSLKRIYYGNFLVLIVVPILLIFVVAMAIVNTLIKNAAISNIKSAQESMMERLNGDVKDASIQLSHLIYNDGGNFLWMASETDKRSTSERNKKIRELENAFQIAMVPEPDIISMQIYMKDGKSVYLKDELISSLKEIKESNWYNQALEQKNIVSIGTYDTSLMPLMYSRQRKWEFIITAALSPNRELDRSGKLEMAAIFYRSDIGDLISKYEKNAIVGTTMILDENDNVIYEGHAGEGGDWYLKQLKVYKEGVLHRKVKCFGNEGNKSENYTFVISELSYTGWKVVNFIPTQKLTERFNQIAFSMLLVLLSLFILFYFYSRYFLKNILSPIHNLVEGMLSVQESNLNVHLEPEGQYEIRQMIHSFNRMVKMLKSSIEENEWAQQKKHEAEIKALQSQINPHFLVNTLNSIRFMAKVSKFDGIRKMAESLIRIVSCSFRSNISFYSLQEEIEVLDSYIYLMRIRYSEGFQVEYEIEEACLGFQVPRLILQPLVENSIVHGFTEEEIGHLKIYAKKEADTLCIKVWDDGRGMMQDEIEQILSFRNREPDDNTSIGMENVMTRLKLNFGEMHRFDIYSIYGEYTEIVLHLPILEEKNEKGTDSR